MLSRRQLYSLESKIEHQVRVAFELLNNSLVYEGTSKPLDGTPLYVYLFGSTAPISIATSATPEITSIFAQMGDMNSGKLQQPIGSLVNVPSVERVLSSLTVPLTNKPIYGKVMQLTLPCSEPVQRLRWWCNESNEKPFVGTTNASNISTNPVLLHKVGEGIRHIYGPSIEDTIHRILSIRERLSGIDERVVKYGTTCVASWGALYKKLPPLFTLYPNNCVRHVTATRGAKDPDPSLLADLNLLAALISAAPKE